MPTHDLKCRVCGTTQRNVYLPLITLTEPLVKHGFLTTQRVDFPLHCDQPMDYIPPRVAMDTFTPFTAEVRQPDGSYRPVAIDSLAKMRAVERSTAQAAANGEGEALRFRMWSNNDSNGDVNSFGPMTPPPLDPKVKKRFGLRGGCIKSVEAPTVELGPGVTDATVSPLSDT